MKLKENFPKKILFVDNIGFTSLLLHSIFVSLSEGNLVLRANEIVISETS